MNQIVLVGRTTRDISVQKTQKGLSVAHFTLAVDRLRSEGTDFIPVTAFGSLADVTAKFVRKGNRVSVSGRLQTESREAQDGRMRTYFDVIAENIEFLEPKSGNEAFTTSVDYRDAPVTTPQLRGEAKHGLDDEDIVRPDDLPF